jgi:hypothetical protein
MYNVDLARNTLDDFSCDLISHLSDHPSLVFRWIISNRVRLSGGLKLLELGVDGGSCEDEKVLEEIDKRISAGVMNCI